MKIDENFYYILASYALTFGLLLLFFVVLYAGYKKSEAKYKKLKQAQDDEAKA